MSNTENSSVRMASARLVTARRTLALLPALFVYCFGATLAHASNCCTITRLIPDDTTIGTWDAENRVFTLTADTGSIEIGESNLTLDGAGHTVSWQICGTGQSNLTIRNVVIQGDSLGSQYRHIFLGAGSSERSSIVIEDNVLRCGGSMGGIVVKGGPGPVDTTIANNVIVGQGRYQGSGFIRTPSVGQHTITGNTITNLGTGSGFAIGVESGPSIVSNNFVSGGGIILFTGSHECTGNIISDTTCGLALGNVEDSCITGNTLSLNDYGIYIVEGEDNWVYNNNFIDNEIQAIVTDSSGNVFSLPSPLGGNYWSDWTGPDSDGDGIVDLPYVFTGGQDDLPWVVQDGWEAGTMIGQLSSDVLALNLQQGIETSLTSLLNAAQQALDDPNATNDIAAINALEAFISVVEALSGIFIPVDDANALIAAAQQIIDVLNAT